MTARIRVTNGEHVDCVNLALGDSLTIGTGPDCDLRIGGLGLADRQFTVFNRGTHCTMDVHDKSIPLLVNGKPPSSVTICHRDTIEVSCLVIRVSIEARRLKARRLKRVRINTPEPRRLQPVLPARVEDDAAFDPAESFVRSGRSFVSRNAIHPVFEN